MALQISAEAKRSLEKRYYSDRKLSSEGGGTGVVYRDPVDWKTRKQLKLVDQVIKEYHIRKVTGNRSTVSCPLCDCKRTSETALRRHLKWEHDL